MNAKEAQRLAEANSARMAEQRKVAQAKRVKMEIAAERNKRAEFKTSLRQDFDSSIKEAVREGRRSTFISVAGSADSPVRAEELLDNHGYKDIIAAVVKEVRADGYKVKGLVRSHKYRTSHESSVPDYDYYDYTKVLEVTW